MFQDPSPEWVERHEREQRLLDRVMPHRRLLNVACALVVGGLIATWVLWLRAWSR